MNKIIYLWASLLILLVNSSAYAQPSGGPAPDIGAGKKRAAACFACHTPEGIAKIPGVPHLAGQERLYLEKALRNYREGQLRQDPTMTAMTKTLSDADIVNIAAYYSLQTRMNNGQTAAQTLETIERIRPIGDVIAKAPTAPTLTTKSLSLSSQTERSGESVYQSTCAACHDSGALGAPKPGDKAAWAPRIAQGGSLLIQHALQGFNAMPAKGSCTSCSDNEIKAAIEFLLAKAR